MCGVLSLISHSLNNFKLVRILHRKLASSSKTLSD